MDIHTQRSTIIKIYNKIFTTLDVLMKYVQGSKRTDIPAVWTISATKFP